MVASTSTPSGMRQLALTMPRDGAIIFRDLVGKLDVLRLECDKCERRGRYRLSRLIARLFSSFFLCMGCCQTGSAISDHAEVNEGAVRSRDEPVALSHRAGARVHLPGVQRGAQRLRHASQRCHRSRTTLSLRLPSSSA